MQGPRNRFTYSLLYLSRSVTLKQSATFPSHQSIFTLTLNKTVFLFSRYSPLQHVVVRMDKMNQWTEGVSGYTFSRPSLRTVCKAKACKVLIRSCHIPTSIYSTSSYATISPPLVISLQMFQPPALWISLVHRPHCLIRRNDLVNRVKFLGLVHTFATMSPRNPLKK